MKREKYAILTSNSGLFVERRFFKNKDDAEKYYYELMNIRDSTFDEIYIIEYSDDFKNYECIKHYGW